MFVLTFDSSKLTSRNWRMHALEDFMESLTQEQENLFQMGTIKYTKDKSIADGVSNKSKGNEKDLKQRAKHEKNFSTKNSSSTGGSSRSKRRKNKRDRPTCGYFIFSHLEISCFRNNVDMMTKILEGNHIDFP